VTGVIDGADGVASSLAATIYNYGAIQGVGGYGVRLTKGGKVRNGAVALIEGAGGVITTGAAVATIANLGEIRASSGYGVLLAGGGTVTNGSASDTRSSIRGQRGLGLAYGTGINYGAIEGYNGVGAAVGGYSILTNGSASDHAALIEGVTGVTLAGAGSSSTLINFGTVEGTGGTAVSLAGPEGRLVLEAGCAFEGAVIGNEGVLVLDAPGAVIALPTTTSIVVSGDMTAHAFSGFGQLDIDAKATASLSGSGTLLGTALEVQGSLSVAGTLRLGVDSVLVVASVAGSKGTLAGGGTLDVLNGGQALFNAGASLATAKVLMSGAASAVTVAPGVNLTYGGTWKQTAGTLTAGTGVFGTGSMTFTGSGNSFGGTLAGQIAITAGSDTFATTSVKGHVTISNTATVTFQGAITIGAANAISVSGGKVIIAATGAYLTGGTMPWATPA
jgi:autotransporter family porin